MPLFILSIISFFKNIFGFLIKNPMILAAIVLTCIMGYMYWDISHLKKTNGELNDTVTAQQVDIKTLNGNIDQYKKNLDDIKKAINERDGVIKSLQDESLKLKDQIAKSKTKLGSNTLKTVEEKQGISGLQTYVNKAFTERLGCLEQAANNEGTCDADH